MNADEINRDGNGLSRKGRSGDPIVVLQEVSGYLERLPCLLQK
jgi:hypothetical protein